MDRFKELFIVFSFICLTIGLLFVAFNLSMVKTDAVVLSESNELKQTATEFHTLDVESAMQVRTAIGSLENQKQVTIWSPSQELATIDSVKLDGETYSLSSTTKIKFSFSFFLILLTGFDVILGIISMALSYDFISRKSHRIARENPNKIRAIHKFIHKFKSSRKEVLIISFILSLFVIITVTSLLPVYSLEKQSLESDTSKTITDASTLSEDEKYELNELASSKQYQINSGLKEYDYIKSNGELYKVIENSFVSAVTTSISFLALSVIIFLVFSFVFSFLIWLSLYKFIQLVERLFTIEPTTADKYEK
jgi:hypothetical protein